MFVSVDNYKPLHYNFGIKFLNKEDKHLLHKISFSTLYDFIIKNDKRFIITSYNYSALSILCLDSISKEDFIKLIRFGIFL